MHKKMLFCLLMIFWFTQVDAEEHVAVLSASDIDKFRNIMKAYSTPEAREIATIYTSSLVAPCERGIWFNSTLEPEAYSVVLAAVMSGRDLEVRYETGSPSPWGDGRWCEAVWVAVSN